MIAKILARDQTLADCRFTDVRGTKIYRSTGIVEIDSTVLFLGFQGMTTRLAQQAPIVTGGHGLGPPARAI